MGHVRSANEDRFLSRSDRGLWAVADGMGGHGGGEAAAALTISALEDIADGCGPLADEIIMQTLKRSNDLIHAPEGSHQRVSGATIVIARQDGDDMVIYWAGDSRAYRISDAKAHLITHDHSVVQEMIDAGAISRAEAHDHPQANLVTRALGVQPQIEIETARAPFYPGDAFLLCSDGLSRSLRMTDLNVGECSPATFADILLANALHRDGTDNVTLVLIRRMA